MQRDTHQRRVIRSVLVQADRPLSPGELLEAARQHASSIGQATVYRNLKRLSETGWVEVVDLPGEPSRYEVAGKGHHHHFVCRSCDGVFEVGGCPGDLDPITPAGFQLEGHNLVLYGLCSTCPPA